MNTSYNKARTILWMGITSLIMFATMTALSIIVAINIAGVKNWIDINFWKEIPEGQLPYVIAIALSSIVYGIVSFVSAIMILVTDFKNVEVNNSKIVWGIVCLLMLGALGAIIFGVISTKKLSATKTIQEQQDQPTI